MTELRATTQAELDAIFARDDLNYSDFEIVIDSPAGVWIQVSGHGDLDVRACDSATVEAYGSATVEACDSATVRAYGSTTVEAYGSATVRACDSATVRAYGSTTVEAYGSATVEACDSATVRAYGSTTVEAYGSTTVRACDSATVRAYGSTTVEAYGSATVEACDSATVRAYGSTTVEAYGSATVRAYGSATVRAGRFVAIHLFSQRVTLHGGVLIDMTRLDRSDPTTWCELMGVEVDGDGLVHLYKAVDADLYAGHPHVKTQYLIGTDPECDVWRDDNNCGGGLHACPTPGMALNHYREATRFLEVTAPLDSIRPVDETKAKAPTVHVLREVDQWMRPIENVEEG